MMTLIGCKQCDRTEPPLKYIKKSPTQEIALFLYSSTRTSMACQKEKNFEKKRLPRQLTFFEITMSWGNTYKVLLHALDHPIVCPSKLKTFFILEITMSSYTKNGFSYLF